MTSETRKKVACIRGVLFDEDKIEECGIDIVEAADYIAQDEYLSAFWLSKSKMYKNKTDDWEWNNSFSGYLATFYIYDDYRKQGIGKHLLMNMNKILKYSLNINLRCLCTYPQPQKAEEWSNIEDKELKQIMIEFFKKYGFISIGKENYYVKEYEFVSS